MHTKIDEALVAHRAGKLEKAAALYDEVLQDAPNHPTANHNLGVICVFHNNLDRALPLLGVALDADPGQAQYWFSYIDALTKNHQLEEARLILEQGKKMGLTGAQFDAMNKQLPFLEERPDLPEHEKLTFTQQRKRSSAKKERKKATGQGQNLIGNTKGPSQTEINQLLAAYEKGDSAAAEKLARSMTQNYPGYALGWNVLGAVLLTSDRPHEAMLALEKGAIAVPNDADICNNLGNAFKNLDEFEKAEASYRKAIALTQSDPGAHTNLGTLLETIGKVDEAEKCHRKAIELQADFLQAHYNLGCLLNAQGRFAESSMSFRRAIELNPVLAQAHSNLSATLIELGELESAEQSSRRAIELNPQLAMAHSNLGAALLHTGKLNEAESSCRRAIALNPKSAHAHSNLGLTLKELGKLEEAQKILRQAISIEPEFMTPYVNIGAILLEQGRSAEAAECYLQAIDQQPAYANAHNGLIFALAHMSEATPEQREKANTNFSKQFEAPYRSSYSPHTNTKNIHRRLRIGFVSGDFYDHAVATFIEPILSHFCNLEDLTLHAYQTHHRNDATTKRLQGYFASWHQVKGLSDDALGQKIRADEIDILIDLSGHTAHNRLAMFAQKPAPLQASWIGFPGTTGLQAMDYYLCDKYWLPSDPFASEFAENLLYLPASAVFRPNNEAPAVSPLPALHKGYITFGNFNRMEKVNQATVKLWAEVLRALPTSKMLIANVRDDVTERRVFDLFYREGIELGRLEIQPRLNLDAYLALHEEVDICLDTIPYGGGTTTLHALWMGVPTLTLAGSTPASRQASSVLTHCDLKQFVCKDALDFVKTSVALATDLDNLSAIRAETRERLKVSALVRSELVAKGLHKGLRMIWERWCVGLPAESFEVDVAA
jgi:protein O-GlcNAc transferase